jgi:hypothetical protein
LLDQRSAIAVRQVCNENLQSLQRYPLIADREYELQIGDGGWRLADFFASCLEYVVTSQGGDQLFAL